MKPQRFRKKPVVVEMMLWEGTPESAAAIEEWTTGHGFIPHDYDLDSAALWVQHNKDWTPLPVGYRVAAELDGSGFYPLSPDGFVAGYESEEEKS